METWTLNWEGRGGISDTRQSTLRLVLLYLGTSRSNAKELMTFHSQTLIGVPSLVALGWSF